LFQEVLSIAGFSSSTFILLTTSALSFTTSCSGGLFLIQLIEFGDIELRLLDGLDLSDDSSAQWVDELAGLGDLLGELFGMVELSNEVNQVGGRGFLSDDFYDLLSNGLNLLLLSVTGLSGLSGLFTSEGSDEHSQDVAVHSLDFVVDINQSLPFSDELTELVSGHIHGVEVGQAVLSLDVFDGKLDLSPCFFSIIQIGEGGFDDSALQRVRGNLCAGGSGDAGLSNDSSCERSRGLNVVPFFSEERVLNLLLGTLLLA